MMSHRIISTPTTGQDTIMNKEGQNVPPAALLRQQSWLSPAFPSGAYSYSHGIEWAVEAGHVHNRQSLVDWLEADLCHGSERNEAIFFNEAWRSALEKDQSRLLEVAKLAAAFRGTSELALESSQQGSATLATLRQVWPDSLVSWLADALRENQIPATLSVVLGIRLARQGLPLALALPAFLQSFVANLVTAGVRLIPLGQTDGQLALSQLEEAVFTASSHAMQNTTDDLGSAAFVVDLSSMAHETQYTRLFRS